jgi:hypothetical protein
MTKPKPKVSELEPVPEPVPEPEPEPEGSASGITAEDWAALGAPLPYPITRKVKVGGREFRIAALPKMALQALATPLCDGDALDVCLLSLRKAEPSISQDALDDAVSLGDAPALFRHVLRISDCYRSL